MAQGSANRTRRPLLRCVKRVSQRLQFFLFPFEPKQQDQENFLMQPLAVTMQSDFGSIYNIIQNVETMNRFVKISSLRISRSEKEASVEAPTLDAAIGIHAMYDEKEVRP